MPSEKHHMKRHRPLRVTQAGAEVENETAETAHAKDVHRARDEVSKAVGVTGGASKQAPHLV